MDKYIGLKVIEAQEMLLGDYNDFRGWTIPANKDPFKEGYFIQYSDGYKSWSPKETFEEAYKKSGELSFEHALRYVKLGFKVARKGWNGKGMYIYMQEGTSISSDDARNNHLSEMGLFEITINPHIDMKTADGSITIGWAPSQMDLFADDWMVVE